MDETIEKVRYLQRKLESYSGEEFPKIIAVLQKLDRLPISIEVLQGTGIGKVVNTFRKYEGGVSEHARNLVKKWKALVQAAMDAQAEQGADSMKVNENEHNMVKVEEEEHIRKRSPDPQEENNSKISIKHNSEKFKTSLKHSDSSSHNLSNSKTSPKSSKSISSNYLPKGSPSKSISSKKPSSGNSLKPKLVSSNSSPKIKEKTHKNKIHSPIVSKLEGGGKNSRPLDCEESKGLEHKRILFVDSNSSPKSGKTIPSISLSENRSVLKKSMKEKIVQSPVVSTSGNDKSKSSSDYEEANQNTGLSFADCLDGSSPVAKVKKLKPKSHVDQKKSPSSIRKLDSKRNEKTDNAVLHFSCGTKNSPSKSNVKTVENKSSHSNDEHDVSKKHKSTKDLDKEMKHKIEQNVKKGSTGSTIHKSVSSTNRKTDNKGSNENSKNSSHKHHTRKEDLSEKYIVNDHKTSSAKISNSPKASNSVEKSDKVKIKKDDKMTSSQKHTSDKSTVNVKEKDHNTESVIKSKKQRTEKPKGKIDDESGSKNERKREYSSGDDSREEICFENTGLSFGDCLFGDAPEPAIAKSTVKKKKTKQKSINVIKQSRSTGTEVKQGKKTEKHKGDIKGSLIAINTKSEEGESSERKRKQAHVPTETPSLKKIKNCYESSILLPEITTDYKPLPRQGDDSSPFKRSQATSAIDDHQIQFKGAKESRTKVFSGKARVYLTAVPTLFDACMRILCDNIDLLEDVGGVPFDILRPVMERCTYQHLYRLEEYNPHFIEDSDYLWQKHVEKEFKLSKPTQAETWRQCYLRSFDEREQKLKFLTQNITASYAKKDTGRKVMLAYVNRPAKAPRNVRRKQEQNGTAGPVTPHEAFANPHKKSPWAVPRNEDTFNPSSKPARTTKIIAPMMQKTLRFIKKLQKR